MPTIDKNCKYGYKICYRAKGSKKVKVYLITNTYDAAIWHIRWYAINGAIDKKTTRLIKNVKWFILPIKTYIEYLWRWRDCPF